MMPNDLGLPGDRPASPPDAEAAAFSRTRDRVYGRGWIRGVRLMALAFTALALVRIVSDTSFDVSPVTPRWPWCAGSCTGSRSAAIADS